MTLYIADYEALLKERTVDLHLSKTYEIERLNGTFCHVNHKTKTTYIINYGYPRCTLTREEFRVRLGEMSLGSGKAKAALLQALMMNSTPFYGEKRILYKTLNVSFTNHGKRFTVDRIESKAILRFFLTKMKAASHPIDKYKFDYSRGNPIAMLAYIQEHATFEENNLFSVMEGLRLPKS